VSRDLSLPALTASYAEETGEISLTLITVNSADLAAPIRLTSDSVTTLSRGDVYQATPFKPIFPSDQPGEIRPVQLSIDNVNRQIVNALRSTQETITVLMESVLFSSPDTVEASATFEVATASYAATEVSLSLIFEPILSEPFPYKRFTTQTAPGLF